MSSNIGKTTTTNQCKRCRIFGDLGQLKSKDTMQKRVENERFVLQTEILGKYIVLVLISLLFYFFSSLRRGDQSTVFCIVSLSHDLSSYRRLLARSRRR